MMTASAPKTDYAPFNESDPAADADTLRARMETDGYLFFRGLVHEDEVLAVRRAMLEFCAEAGWLDTSRDLMEGIVAPGVNPTTEGRADYNAVYRKILKHPGFDAFPEQPGLLTVARALLESEEVLVHPRRIGRITFPNNPEATTPAHQDHFYIRGTVATYSCWVPLGDCPITLGGLAVARGSHKQGFIEHTERFPAAVGGRGVPTDESIEWHSSDFAPGDALFFHAYTIHKALPNRTENRLRLSTDNRYQRPAEEIHPGALKPHLGLDLSE